MGLLMDNPVTSVQTQLRGGWKNLFLSAGTYALIVFGAMGIWAEVDPKHRAEAAMGWTVVLMLIQIGLVLFFSVVRVSNAVRSDNASGIMESHRLMPMTGLTAGIGFVVGPTLQMIAIGVVTCLAGVVTSTVAGFDSSRWIKCNVILLAFLLFTCTCSMLVGFYRRALFNSLIVLVVIACFSQGMLLYAVPGMAVLTSPLAGDSIFNPRGKIDLFNPGMQWAFVGQAIIAAIMLAAAARKFREPERPAFSISLSLILLAAWVILNLIGVLKWLDIEPVFFRYSFWQQSGRLKVQFTGSVLTGLLLCLLPISATVRRSREQRDIAPGSHPNSIAAVGRGSTPSGVGDMDGFVPVRSGVPRRALMASPVLTILVCVFLLSLLLAIPICDEHYLRPELIAGASISLAASVISLGTLLIAYRSTARKVVFLVFIFLLVTWLFPLFADVFKHEVMLSDEDSLNAPWSLTAFGPIGSMLAPWDREMQTKQGLYCQVAIAVVLSAIAAVAERSRGRKQTQTDALGSTTAVLPSASPMPILPLAAQAVELGDNGRSEDGL